MHNMVIMKVFETLPECKTYQEPQKMVLYYLIIYIALVQNCLAISICRVGVVVEYYCSLTH